MEAHAAAYKTAIDDYRSVTLTRAGLPRPFSQIPSPDAHLDISVCARVRPLLDFDPPGALEAVSLANPFAVVHGLGTTFDDRPRVTHTKHRLDHAFSANDDNLAVYDVVARPLVELAVGGGASTLLAFGQSASGKTYTLSGLSVLLVDDLFRLVAEAEDPFSPIDVHVGFFELRGDVATDLLAGGTELKIVENVAGEVVIHGLTEAAVGTCQELLDIVALGSAARATSPTLRNAQSSRSHGVLRIRIHNSALPAAEDGLLLVVDLAGSEAAEDRREHDAALAAESRDINRTLHVLKECIRGRAIAAATRGKSQQHTHVPYRQSKLTLLLKPVFEVGALRRVATTVIFCVSPLPSDAAQTSATLASAAHLLKAARAAKEEGAAPTDTADPVSWTGAKARAFVAARCEELGSTAMDLDAFFGGGLSGLQLCRMPQQTFMKRVIAAGGSAKVADTLYRDLWELLSNVRTEGRRARGITSSRDALHPSDEQVLIDASAADVIESAIPDKTAILPAGSRFDVCITHLGDCYGPDDNFAPEILALATSIKRRLPILQQRFNVRPLVRFPEESRTAPFEQLPAVWIQVIDSASRKRALQTARARAAAAFLPQGLPGQPLAAPTPEALLRTGVDEPEHATAPIIADALRIMRLGFAAGEPEVTAVVSSAAFPPTLARSVADIHTLLAPMALPAKECAAAFTSQASAPGS
jgi:kinesin family protein 2/24